jgi:hypothetical protein
MKTKAQIIDDISNLISFVRQNKQSLSESQSIFSPSCNREILTIKNYFHTVVDNLTSEFTEQELYTIENNLLFYYQTLKEIIYFISYRFKNNNPPIFINPIQQPNNFIPYPPVTLYDVESSIIQQEDIDKYTIYVQHRIEGIIKEIEKNQKIQLRKIAKIYDLYNGLADNLDQQMMAMDEQLYVMQTQRQEATIKNIINDLDGV